MKDKLTFNFTVSEFFSKGFQTIKLLFKIIFFGFYYYCLFSMVKFYFFPNIANITSGQACAAGYMTFFYPILITIVTIIYLVCISVYSRSSKHKSSYYKLVLYPIIFLIVSIYLYTIRNIFF